MENGQLLEYIGETKTNNLIEKINKEYFEIFHKKFPSYNEMLKASSLVTVTKENEIKSIGMSCMNDLLSNNYGIYLASLFGGQLAVQTLKDITNADRNVTFFGAGANFNSTTGVACGTQIQIGQGSTLAVRTDFNIETPFATSPESLIQNTNAGGWNSALGQILASMVSIGAGGAGTVSETIFVHAMNSLATQRKFLMSRDNISPGASFILGQTINVNYTFLFS